MYTKQQLLNALIAHLLFIAKKIGHIPTVEEYQNQQTGISENNYARHFGSWSNAISIAFRKKPFLERIKIFFTKGGVK